MYRLYRIGYSILPSVCTACSRSVKSRVNEVNMITKCFPQIFVLILLVQFTSCGPEEAEGIKYASKCEVCKVMAVELESRLEETGKSHDVLEIGYSFDDTKPKKRTKYKGSELRLVESLDGVCDRILEYNIHKERYDSTRFAKGMSQTFKTLHDLVDKGVKVELGIPYEIWDKPSVEITNLKSQCEKFLEANEGDIEDWYFNLQGEVSLKQYLCSDRILKDEDDSCLNEDLKPNDKKSKQKGETSSKPDKDKTEL